MAWSNINERRAKVKYLLSVGMSLRQIKNTCSTEFGCSKSAITSDVHFLNGNGTDVHLSKAIRERIRNRDNYTCQYCGVYRPYSGIVEHVIPFAIGGNNRDYNLVFACQKCNVKKRRNVWIPRNFYEITKNNPEWIERAKKLLKNI